MHSRALIVASTDKSEASMESGRPPSMDLTGKSRPESQSASSTSISFTGQAILDNVTSARYRDQHAQHAHRDSESRGARPISLHCLVANVLLIKTFTPLSIYQRTANMLPLLIKAVALISGL